MVIKEFLKLVSNKQDSFSQKEKVLVNYVIDNLEEVINLTMNELLIKSNCGYSTIYSLFHKMGFDGYRDFILSLHHELDYDQFSLVSSKKNQQVLSEYLVLLTRTNNWLDEILLQQASSAMNKSNEIYVLGINEFDVSALYAVSRLNALKHKALHLVSYGEKISSQLQFAKTNDILIIINNLQEKIITWQVCEIANKLKMKVIVIGSIFSNNFSTENYFVFPITFHNNHNFDWSLSSNYLGSFFVIDNLLYYMNKLSKK